MPTILMILAFLMICFLGIGAEDASSQSPKKGGMITVGTNMDMPTVDIHATSAFINAVLMSHVHEPLLSYGENYELVPVLAERWEVTPDFKKYTFFLRKGKLFHNGNEMVADDVKYSIERFMKVSPRKAQLKADHIETLDKYRVRIHMKETDATLLGTLANYEPCLGIVPQGAGGPKGEITHPVGTGPFKFVEWKLDRHLLLERFDQYVPQPGPMNGLGGERIAYLEKIKFVPIREESVAIMALLNKEVDFLWFVPHNRVETFLKDYAKKGIVLDRTLGGAFYFMIFNMREGITKNLDFRKACAHAIDAKMIMDGAVYGNGKAASSFVPQINPLFTPFHNTWYKKDVQKAKDLLKASGYQGEVLEVIASKQYEPMYKSIIAAQSELAAIGINTKLTLIEYPNVISRMYKNEFDICSSA